MASIKQLRALGQSLWLDNISRPMLDDGTLERYCAEFSLTGLTSNPTIFDQAIRGSDAYDKAISQSANTAKTDEEVFFGLALDDLRRAADVFRPAHDASGGIDGWVSMEVSPLLINDAKAMAVQARALHEQADCKNLLIKIPGTQAGLAAIEESIFSGVPINVTLLFSREQYMAASDAYWQGIARRIDGGLDPRVHCVASIFVSRWDKAVAGKLPPDLDNRLGTSVCGQVYKTCLERLSTSTWQRLSEVGALPQRLLWASTGTKDPALPITYYVDALAAPDTINTMPEKTLQAIGQQDAAVPVAMARDGVEAERLLAAIEQAGVDVSALGERLQEAGGQAFKKSWNDLLANIAAQRK